MTQRALAVRTSFASLVVGGRLESQYLVGSASPLGHSISSHSSGQGSLRWVSPCAGRTRRAAKRDTRSPRLPSPADAAPGGSGQASRQLQGRDRLVLLVASQPGGPAPTAGIGQRRQGRG